MDHNVGRMVAALAAAGLENSTAIILFGDHGWQLGENGEWRKNTNFELGTRVPLVVHVPWLPASAGKRTSALTELVDVMASAAELAGLPAPPATDGTSFVPVLDGRAAAMKNVSASQYPRLAHPGKPAWADNGIDHTHRANFTHMGYSIRTADWRYTAWYPWDGARLCARWAADTLTAAELYDHRGEAAFPSDFDAGERENVAAAPEHAALLAELGDLLKLTFPKAPCPPAAPAA